MSLKCKKWLFLALLALIPILGGCKLFTSKEKLRKPGAPSNLVATAVSYSQIDLTWQDNSNNEAGFRVGCNIYRGGDYYEVADLPANTTYFAHSGLEPLRKHTYYVQAYNETGAANSNIAEAITLSGVEILDYELEKRSDYVKVTGHARNTTKEMLQSVIFTYWFYDANDILIGSMDDGVWSIPPLTTFEFGQTGYGCSGWDRIEYVTVAVTDVDIEGAEPEPDRSEGEMKPETEQGLRGGEER